MKGSPPLVCSESPAKKSHSPWLLEDSDIEIPGIFSCSLIGALQVTPIGALQVTPIGALQVTPIGALQVTPIGALQVTPIGALQVTPIGALQVTPIFLPVSREEITLRILSIAPRVSPFKIEVITGKTSISLAEFCPCFKRSLLSCSLDKDSIFSFRAEKIFSQNPPICPH